MWTEPVEGALLRALVNELPVCMWASECVCVCVYVCLYIPAAVCGA